MDEDALAADAYPSFGGTGSHLRAARKLGKVQGVALEGGEELQESLAKLEEHVTGTFLLAAVRRGAEIPRSVAEQLAPWSAAGSHGREAGFLADNVLMEDTVTEPTYAEEAVGVHMNAFYGRFQELGTVYQSAQPFLRPAFDETKDDIVDQVGETLRALIESSIVTDSF